ncbi:hypothetical protein [Brachyspira hyodysenteriae]|uniref:hypothetical protein n=1 Tax=Brachyspira hyodysenteriae TaxID=159 RepID=UPI00069A3AEF|nr:hypothetical protein [Brachyspira hyodysenteriae]
MATNQIDFTLNADTSSFETNINNSSKAIEKLSKNNNELNGSLEDVSKFMEETAKVNIDLTKQINNLSKAFDDSISSTNKGAKSLDDISKEAKDAANEIKKLSNATKDIEKNSKAGNLALEAIKDNLGSIPVLGPTATRALDGLEGSFSKLVLAGAGVGAVTGAIAGLGATIYGAYTQSEKFRDSIEDFKNNAAVAFSPVLDKLEDVGDFIGNIVNGLNEWIDKNNKLNGVNVDNLKNNYADIVKEQSALISSKEAEINLDKILGYSIDEIKKKEEDLLQTRIDNARVRYTESEKSRKESEESIKILEKQISAQEKIIAQMEANPTQRLTYNGPSNEDLLPNARNQLEKYKNKLIEATKAEQDFTNERDKAKTEAEKLNQEIIKLNASTKKNTKDVKAQLTPYQQLIESLNDVVEVRNAEARIIEDNYTGKEKELESVKANINALEQQKQLITSYYLEAKKQGKDYYDESLNGIIAQINGNEEVTGSVEDLGKALQKINQLLAEQKKQYEDLNKPLLDLKAIASQIISSVQSAYNSIGSAVMSIKSLDLIDTSKFDEQIEYIQNKLDEFDEEQKKKEEEKQELSDEEYENYLARLDEEYQKAVEANDLMSQEAIRIKKEELQNKKEQEKKELEEEKKVNKQREELERQLAEAQYNKDYAEWQNQVKLAELQKNKAIADAIILPALATAQAALGLATSFAEGGPGGFAAGVALSATAIGSAVGAAAGVASAASALDNVKSNPPEMPRFEFGTTGYYLGYEETALVGERGPELVKNMGGILQVQSAVQTEAMGNRGGEKIGMYIENLVFNVAQRLTAEEIYEFMTSFKARNLRFRR